MAVSANLGFGVGTFGSQQSLAFFIPHRRSIGGIIAQVTIDEQATDDIQITEHPVEQGAPIADHAFKRPPVVTIRAGWTRQYARDLSAETGVYGLLLSWQAALLPFDVYTGKRTYSNMLIERLQVQTDNHNEYTLLATITCRQIIIVSTSTANVPGMGSNSNQKDPSATGSTGDSGTKSPEKTGSVTTPTNEAGSLTPPLPSQPSGGRPSEGTPEAGTITPTAETVNSTMAANGATPPNTPGVLPPPTPYDPAAMY